jgi:transposase
MTKLIVGVDISKASFSAAGLGADGKESFAGSYTMDREGFNKLLESITSYCPDLQEVLVGMESTGCYQINLFSFLNSHGIRALVINPLLIANFAKLSLRKTKTDKKDAKTIARFLVVHQEGLSQLSLSENCLSQHQHNLFPFEPFLCHDRPLPVYCRHIIPYILAQFKWSGQ